MITTYPMPDGSLRTTCGQHRTLGYAVAGCNLFVCRGCGGTQSFHETAAETIARKALSVVEVS